MAEVADEDLISAPGAVSGAGEDHTPFTTVTYGMRGYFAVLMWWNDKDIPGEGFWEPWQSGIGSYKTAAHAWVEARQWAQAEGMRCE